MQSTPGRCREAASRHTASETRQGAWYPARSLGGEPVWPTCTCISKLNMPVGLEVLLHLVWAHWPNMLPDQGPATGTQKMMQQAVTAPEALEAGKARV
eukprot:6580297-Lingulodinium_polyedra.AAC.1